jgi:methionyl-tRNA formyltransferase
MKITKENLKIVFYGTPSFAVPTLEKIANKVVLVVTSPGETPVKEVADKHLIPVYQTGNTSDPGLLEVLKKYQPNLGIVIAFKILPPSVFEFPELGTFNIHASLLPDYRGAAPINWAIINGDKWTGLTAFWLDKGVDTGRIISQTPYFIDPSLSFGQVYQNMARNTSNFCINTIEVVISGKVDGEIQVTTGKEKKAPKLTRANTWIDWGEPAGKILDFIRGLSPKPGALSLVFGQECKILSAWSDMRMISNQKSEPGTELVIGKDLYIMTGDFWLGIETLWKAGGKGPITGKDFVNGMRSQGKKMQ